MVTRSARIVPLLGLAAWLASLVLVPAPLEARIALIAPLVVVPRLLVRLSERRIGGAAMLTRVAGWPALLVALPLPVAFALEPGTLAVLATTPWLVLASACGLAAASDALPRLRTLFRPMDASRLAADGALGFLAIGGLALAADRAAIRPLDFSATIVLLTAVHFLVAGFGLLASVALAIEASGASSSRFGTLGRVAALGLVIGMPLTAAGFVLAAPAVNWAGSMVVASSGLAAAGGFAARAGSMGGSCRVALGLAAAALTVAMPLAVVYATGTLIAAGPGAAGPVLGCGDPRGAATGWRFRPVRPARLLECRRLAQVMSVVSSTLIIRA